MELLGQMGHSGPLDPTDLLGLLNPTDLWGPMNLVGPMCSIGTTGQGVRWVKWVTLAGSKFRSFGAKESLGSNMPNNLVQSVRWEMGLGMP